MFFLSHGINHILVNIAADNKILLGIKNINGKENKIIINNYLKNGKYKLYMSKMWS